MTRTHEEYKQLLKECREGKIKDESEFAKLINMLILEILLDLSFKRYSINYKGEIK